MEETNTRLHINEVEGLKFAHIHLQSAQSELALAIRYLTSATESIPQYTWERISTLSDMGSLLSEMMDDMREQVMSEICDCEACTARRQGEVE